MIYSVSRSQARTIVAVRELDAYTVLSCPATDQSSRLFIGRALRSATAVINVSCGRHTYQLQPIGELRLSAVAVVIDIGVAHGNRAALPNLAYIREPVSRRVARSRTACTLVSHQRLKG